MTHFENQLITKALISAGWHENRRIDVSETQRRIISDGFSWSEAAEGFLVEFGELLISPIRTPDSTFASGDFATNPLLVTGESLRIRGREQVGGVKLTPIGEWMDEAIILIDDNHNFYFETTYQFSQIANSIVDLFEVVILALRQVGDVTE